MYWGIKLQVFGAQTSIALHCAREKKHSSQKCRHGRECTRFRFNCVKDNCDHCSKLLVG